MTTILTALHTPTPTPAKSTDKARRAQQPPGAGKDPARGAAGTAALTVGLLVARARARTTVLLGLLAARVGHKQGPVVADEQVLDLLLGGLVDVCWWGLRGRRGWWGEQGVVG